MYISTIHWGLCVLGNSTFHFSSMHVLRAFDITTQPIVDIVAIPFSLVLVAGTARTSLVVTIGPSPRHRGETASTILFGQRVSFVV